MPLELIGSLMKRLNDSQFYIPFSRRFFDAAFYSLRQSIEISIGTLYLTANPEKLEKWKALEPGFESGKMVCFLKTMSQYLKI